MLKVRLARNLRRSILRGHPWVYREALVPLSGSTRAELCRVADAKGELCWAIHDPHSPLALRILSFEKSPPTRALYESRMQVAWDLRTGIRCETTTAYRLFNGEGDLLPGLVCDVYGTVAVVQLDGKGPAEFWDKQAIGAWLAARPGIESVYVKGRRGSDDGVQLIGGVACDLRALSVLEHAATFEVDVERGQKTGFFLDQRENRLHVRVHAAGKNILNLFSYTGGFTVAAGLGGATHATSVDLSKGAIEIADRNWRLNGLDPAKHKGISADVFEFLSVGEETWDHVIVDPPSMSHTESGRETAVAKYIELFGASARRVRKGGELSVSSCSSHVSFEDFFGIMDEALSLARRTGRVLRLSGQGADHPYPHACRELRYLKYAHLVLD